MKRRFAFCVCIVLSGSTGAADIGRLFFTPAERAQLDLARTHKKVAKSSPAPQQTETALPEVITYSGIVRRSDGKSMLWINNQLADEKEALGGLNLKGTIRPDGAVSLHVPQSTTRIDVKVGQSVDLNSGRVAEGRRAPPHVTAPAVHDSRPPGPETKPAAAAPPATTDTNDNPEKKAQSERRQAAAAAAAALPEKQRTTGSSAAAN